MVRLTPGMQQYMNIKNKYPDTLVLFRMGDFYETFFEDAKTASRELNITLTARGKGDSRAPLAGIPYHALEQYLIKLVKKGYKVAIVEQTEDPKLAKGLVKRDLVRIVTPGTVMETAMLHDKRNNYIMSIARENGVFGVALADISTGEFFTTEVKDYEQLLNEISRYAPTECVVPISIEDDEKIVALKERTVVHSFDDRHFWDQAAVGAIFNHFQVQSLAGFGLEGKQLCVNASGALLSYLKETQKTSLQYVNSLRYLTSEQYMAIDASTQRNLELVKNIREGTTKNTLLEALDATLTPMGGRLLRKWLLQPLLSIEDIRKRQDAAVVLLESLTKREDVRSVLKKITDVERLISKLNYGNANARDLLSLHNALHHVPLIKRLLSDTNSNLLSELAAMPDVVDVVSLIANSIKDDPPISIREGWFIKEGYNEELDKLRAIINDSKGYILRLEEEERRKTGIKSLKIKFNRVFGYFIEVTKPNLHLVPGHYVRKQTQVNAERFITEDLKQKESEILGAEEKIVALEYELFCDVVSKVVAKTKEVQTIASSIATLDVIQSFAYVAAEYNYVKPEVNDSNCIVIRDGRHPVIERIESFYVPNDITLDSENRTHIITGPNMAGKCVIGESIIFSDLGMIPIKHFKPDKLASEKFSPLELGVCGVEGHEKTSHFYYDGKRHTIKITTKFGYEIEGTVNHPILVRTKEGKEIWMRLGEIQKDDFIVINRKIDLWGKVIKIPKKILEEVSKIDYNNMVIKYKLPKFIDEDLAYFMGLLIGDGTLTLKNYVILSNVDKQIVGDFFRISMDKFACVPKTKKSKPDHVISSQRIRAFLDQLGLGFVNSLNKEVPYCILQAPKNIVREFLRGLFDTDGFIDKRYGSSSVSTSSIKLARQVQLILLNFGIVSSLKEKKTKRNKSYTVYTYGENSILFHKLIGFKLERKSTRQNLASKKRMPNYGIPYMRTILKQIQKRIVYKQDKPTALKKVKNINSVFYSYLPRNRNISYNKLRELIDYCDHNGVNCKELKEINRNYYFYDSIAKIEVSAKKKDVYDFTVPKTNSFTANGLINHNSSFMRQVALIVLMTQIGSMVPAKSASVGVVDRIFTRVGAFDDLASGQSTFMVEMTETANILNNATDRSFIILDEIGRGTSTYDGISIAWAVAEYIHSEIGAKTLFATHYHQMNRLAELFPGVKNYNIAVQEKDDEIVFLRKVVEGGTDKSYGIQVAKLAGVPAPVINRSKKIMNKFSVEDEISERLHGELKPEPEKKEEEIKKENSENKNQKTLLDLE